MNIQINSLLTPFRDKEGPYVEVLAVLSTKLVLLYAVEQTDNVDVSVHDYKVGDKIYFNEDGQIKRTVKFTVETTSTNANKQSPSRTPIDPNSRI